MDGSATCILRGCCNNHNRQLRGKIKVCYVMNHMTSMPEDHILVLENKGSHQRTENYKITYNITLCTNTYLL